MGIEEPVEQRVGRTQMKFNIRTTVAVAANYRHGRVRTSLEVEGAKATATDPTVNALLDLARGGNPAWLGQVDARVVDESGRELGRTVRDVVVYRPLRRGIKIPRDRPHSRLSRGIKGPKLPARRLGWGALRGSGPRRRHQNRSGRSEPPMRDPSSGLQSPGHYRDRL